MKWKEKSYLQKNAVYKDLVAEEPVADLFNIIVIPCYNEPNISRTIDSLFQCQIPQLGIEIIVVINAALTSGADILAQNRKSEKEIATLKEKYHSAKINLHCVFLDDLPSKHAGVGLARKIGLDEAVARFEKLSGKSATERDGILTCLDADCIVEENYFTAIEEYFLKHNKCPGVSIKYAHEIAGRNDIASYELHLRYYNQGLLYAGFPFAYHTVGSSMAVRQSHYQKQGGMNKRKAGEDFYFLHKFIKLNGFGHIDATTVIPSSRESNRVPFGTGRAMINMKSEDFKTYKFTGFEQLKKLLELIPTFHQNLANLHPVIDQLPEHILTYLGGVDSISERITASGRHSTDLTSFSKRFFDYIDAFWVMKYLNWRRVEEGGSEITLEASKLLTNIDGLRNIPSDLQSLLEIFRRQKRE